MRRTLRARGLAATVCAVTLLALAASPTVARADLPQGAAAPTPANPALLPAHLEQPKIARYASLGGSLYHAGVKVTDVDQGAVGDCYFLAAAAAVAQRRPDLIKQALTPNRDGTVTVRLFRPTSLGPNATLGTVSDTSKLPRDTRFAPVRTAIDRQVPVFTTGKVAYAEGHNTRHVELWPSMLEKGFAKLAGGYDPIRGGHAARAFEMLTGVRARVVRTEGADLDGLFDTLRDASRQGRPMTAGTYKDASFAKRLAATPPSPETAKVIDAAKKLGGTPYGKTTGVVAGHEYTVLGVEEKNGERLVVLRNPWGHLEPGAEGFGEATAERRGDGIFRLPLATFATLYGHVAIAGVASEPSDAR